MSSSRKLGYFCSYTPEEIIHAANITPVWILGNTQSTSLADAYVPSKGVCSYMRSCFHSALEGSYDTFEAYVMCTTCDNLKKMYDIWKEHIKIPHSYLLRIPRSKTKLAYKFFLKEILKFKEWIEKSFKVKISVNSVESAIGLYNETRKLLKELYEMRKEDPPLISGVEAYSVLLKCLTMPKDKFNQMLYGLLSKPIRRKEKKEGVRLLLSGAILGSTELIEIIEKSGGVVVADDLCTGTRYFWDFVDEKTDPFSALAKRYLYKVPCPFMHNYEARLDHVKRLIEEYKVHGVIFLAMDCCDIHLYNIPILMDELRRIGIPTYLLEIDHVLSGKASLKTRIEAFIEVLRRNG